MSVDGGTNPGANWDEARIALGRVADVFRESERVTREDLQAVEGYGVIPEGVRDMLESLTPDEQLAAKKVFATLAGNHFYVEGGPGGLRFY